MIVKLLTHPANIVDSSSNIKVILRVFFHYRGVVHYKFYSYAGPNCQQRILFKHKHLLRRGIRLKQPQLWVKTLVSLITIMHYIVLHWLFAIFCQNII